MWKVLKLHLFYGFYNYFFLALRTNIYFATCTGKTVATGSFGIEVCKFKSTFGTVIIFLFFGTNHFSGI
jgi:hypothetical protein